MPLLETSEREERDKIEQERQERETRERERDKRETREILERYWREQQRAHKSAYSVMNCLKI